MLSTSLIRDEGAPPLSFPFLERQGGEVGVEFTHHNALRKVLREKAAQDDRVGVETGRRREAYS